MYIAGIAYLDRGGTLRDIAGNLRRRQQPPKPRRAAINKHQLERVAENASTILIEAFLLTWDEPVGGDIEALQARDVGSSTLPRSTNNGDIAALTSAM